MCWKKTREFPLRGPTPCGKAGLSPCKNVLFLPVCLPHFFPAIRPSSQTHSAFYMNCWFTTGLPKKIQNIILQSHQHSEQNSKVIKWKLPKKLQSSFRKRLFIENLEQTPKMRWKISWEFRLVKQDYPPVGNVVFIFVPCFFLAGEPESKLQNPKSKLPKTPLIVHKKMKLLDLTILPMLCGITGALTKPLILDLS